ncbi:hypothetical protein [Salipiger thiooxidans]|uniref:hypothetical protein n=1 Tax=Salipiger thiooxidans TaxID=282683 RepID=UPI001CFAC8EB|nr:hypothetical protein [Salipiger thiooxidans]
MNSLQILLVIMLSAGMVFSPNILPADVRVCSCPGNHNWPVCSEASTGAELCGPICREIGQFEDKKYSGTCGAPQSVFTCENPYGLDVRYNGHNKFDLIDKNAQTIWESPSFETGRYKWTGIAMGLLGDNMWLRCRDDILFGQNIITVRHGRNLDLIYLIGVSSGGIVALDARLQDGDHHGVTIEGDSAIIALGENKDVRIRYCFDGKVWTSSSINRPVFSGFSATPQITWSPGLDCAKDAIVFFDGATTEFQPYRTPPPSPKIEQSPVLNCGGVGQVQCP